MHTVLQHFVIDCAAKDVKNKMEKEIEMNVNKWINNVSEPARRNVRQICMCAVHGDHSLSFAARKMREH